MARTFPTLASRREVLEGPSTCIFAQRRRHRLGAAPAPRCFRNKHAPKSSGEATTMARLLAGNEEQDDLTVLWNFIWPLTRAASSGGLDKLPVLVRVTAKPTYAVTRSPRNLGPWPTYETPSLKAGVDAL
ncbi:hypothetical protein PPROV_000289900 [Pycnococcus provasolii]|uniref:Uncharacterized protein n=1 Tax=Pycnococcus provasolii TaxID=41880 RepID=A0A830HAY7_9CHLO|nr:hypothetical protein PPROV_000289900 [Pycnococcus provasolii]